MKGFYVLLLELGKDSEIRVGILGNVHFRKGFYAYVGSGMGSLEKRIERHLLRKKKEHWHIDSFLKRGKIQGVIYSESPVSKECELAGKMAGRFKGVRGFGCSDCRCSSHLFFSEKRMEEAVLDAFTEAGAVPEFWDQNSSSNSA